jgi:uncharacterized protein DUF3551
VRRYMLAVAAIAAIGGINLGAVPSAKAQDTYCLAGRSEGSPGDCSYSTYAQCQASASGRDGTCGLNPRVAFSGQPRQHRQRYERAY